MQVRPVIITGRDIPVETTRMVMDVDIMMQGKDIAAAVVPMRKSMTVKAVDVAAVDAVRSKEPM